MKIMKIKIVLGMICLISGLSVIGSSMAEDRMVPSNIRIDTKRLLTIQLDTKYYNVVPSTCAPVSFYFDKTSIVGNTNENLFYFRDLTVDNTAKIKLDEKLVNKDFLRFRRRCPVNLPDGAIVRKIILFAGAELGANGVTFASIAIPGTLNQGISAHITLGDNASDWVKRNTVKTRLGNNYYRYEYSGYEKYEGSRINNKENAYLILVTSHLQDNHHIFVDYAIKLIQIEYTMPTK